MRMDQLRSILLAFLENRQPSLLRALEATWVDMSSDARKAYKQGVQDGVALAESLAEVSEHDGWHRTDPFIDWSGVRKALTAYVEVILR